MLNRLNNRLRRQDAMVLPTTMWVMFVMLLFGGAAASSAIVANAETRTDSHTKRAIASADAAIDIAIQRLNSLDASDRTCPVLSSDGSQVVPTELALGGTAWCPPVSELQADGAQTSYSLSPPTNATTGGCSSGTATRTLVAVGTSGNRTRAVATTLATLRGPVFPCAVVAMDDIILDNFGKITGDVGTNGRLRALDYDTRMCGNVTGLENQYHNRNDTWSCVAGAYAFTPVPAEAGFARQAPTAPPLSAMSNGRITAVDSGGCGAAPDCESDIIAAGGTASDVDWDPDERTLTLKNNVHLTLTGAMYNFCFLKLKDNAQLVISPNHSVKIYMDTRNTNPDSDCGVHDPGLVLSDAGTIVNNNPGRPSTLAIIGLGTPRSRPGQNDCTQEPTMRFRQDSDSDAIEPTIPMVIRAPSWCVRIAGGLSIDGAVIAQRLVIRRNGALSWNDDALNFGTPAEAAYLRLNDWRTCGPVNPAGYTDSTCNEAPHPQ